MITGQLREHKDTSVCLSRAPPGQQWRQVHVLFITQAQVPRRSYRLSPTIKNLAPLASLRLGVPLITFRLSRFTLTPLRITRYVLPPPTCFVPSSDRSSSPTRQRPR